MRSQFLIPLALLAATAVPALAQPFTMNGTTYNVADIAGAGDSKALLEIDFGTAASPNPYLFGYEWSSTAPTAPTGRDILSALQSNNNGLTFTDTYYASFDEHLLNTLWYQSNQPADNYPSSFWLYFTANDPTSWTEASLGYDAIAATNNGFFAWAWQPNDPNYPDYPNPALPPSHFPAAITSAGTPVPEPASLSLLSVGTLLLLKRRRA